MVTRIIKIFVGVFSLVTFVGCINTINWSLLESPEDNVSIKYPSTVENAAAGKGQFWLSGGYVNLIGWGKIREPMVSMFIYDKDLAKLPPDKLPVFSDVDITDPLSLVAACTKSRAKLRTSGEVQDEFEVLEPPQITSFNGYEGAKTTFKNKHFLVLGNLGDKGSPILTMITYDAVIIDDKRIICAHGAMLEQNEGSSLLPTYVNELLNTIELY